MFQFLVHPILAIRGNRRQETVSMPSLKTKKFDHYVWHSIDVKKFSLFRKQLIVEYALLSTPRQFKLRSLYIWTG